MKQQKFCNLRRFLGFLPLYDCKTIHVPRVFSRYTFYEDLISHSPYLANISHCAHKLHKCLVVTSKNICETRSFHVIVFTTKFFFTCPSTECNQDWPNNWLYFIKIVSHFKVFNHSFFGLILFLAVKFFCSDRITKRVDTPNSTCLLFTFIYSSAIKKNLMSSIICNICLAIFNIKDDSIHSTSCGHVFHENCLNQALRQ